MAADEQGYTLSVEGSDAGGLEISRLTSLREIRRSFPVPDHFAFGVPQYLEGECLASEYQPLVLLNTDEVLVAKLARRPSQVAELQTKVKEAQAQLADERKRSARLIAQARTAHEAELGRMRGRYRGLIERLAAEPARLRNELASLRASVVALQDEAAALIRSGLQQAARQVDASTTQRPPPPAVVSAEASAAQAEVQSLRSELRALHTAHEAELRIAESRQGALEDRHRQQQQELVQRVKQQQQSIHALQQQLHQHQQQAPASAKPSTSAFSDYMRTSTFIRECDALHHAAKRFYSRPQSPSSRDAFLAALAKLSSSSGAGSPAENAAADTSPGLAGAPAAMPRGGPSTAMLSRSAALLASARHMAGPDSMGGGASGPAAAGDRSRTMGSHAVSNRAAMMNPSRSASGLRRIGSSPGLGGTSRSSAGRQPETGPGPGPGTGPFTEAVRQQHGTPSLLPQVAPSAVPDRARRMRTTG
jgi:hypothetical protein